MQLKGSDITCNNDPKFWASIVRTNNATPDETAIQVLHCPAFMSMCIYYDRLLHLFDYTVKPVMRGHPKEGQKVAA